MRLRRVGRAWVVVGGPVPRGFDAITIGRIISVRQDAAGSAGLLRHELVHVEQYRRLGMPRFLARYLAAYLRGRVAGYGHLGAYRRIPMEIEAVWLGSLSDAASPVRSAPTEEPPWSPHPRSDHRPAGETDLI